MNRILVAGIGNIFFGDDAFGCEVAKALQRRPQPEGVRVVDFGIRSYDLAYALMDDYHARILVDALPRGSPPGTLYIIEPDVKELDEFPDEVVSAHSMNPLRVLQMVRSLGGQPGSLLIVGCEPAILEAQGGQIGLSEEVLPAIPSAVAMIEKLISDLNSAGSTLARGKILQTKSASET